MNDNLYKYEKGMNCYQAVSTENYIFYYYVPQIIARCVAISYSW